MRKLLSIIVTILIIVAIGLLLPYFMGVLAQKKCQEVAGTMASLARVEVTVTDYQRHWFASDATFTLKLRKPLVSNDMSLGKVDQQLQQWTVTAHILHGPIVISPSSIKLAQAVVEAEVVLTKEQKALLQRENSADPLAAIVLGINLDGSSSLRIKGSPLVYKGEQTSLNLQGINVQVTFSAFLNQIKSTINLSSLDFTHADSVLHLEEVAVSYAGEKKDFDLWVGQRQAAIKSLIVKNGSDENLAVTGFALNTNVGAERHLVTASSTITIDSLNFNNMNYTQNTVVWEAANLDVAALARLQHEFRKLSDMSEPSMQQGLSIAKYFGLLLSKGATLTIKQITSHTPWGEFQASGRIDMLKTNDDNVLTLLTNICGEVNLQAAPSLAQYLLAKYYGNSNDAVAGNQVSPEEQAKNTLNDWLKSGAIIKAGDAYKAAIKYDKQWLINGKPMSLTAVQQQLPINVGAMVAK